MEAKVTTNLRKDSKEATRIDFRELIRQIKINTRIAKRQLI